MRLVKRSVNQDDVSAYHLFYADAKGTPGTDLTFFDWPAPPEGGGYRIEVKGSPSFRVELSMLGEDGDHNTGGLLATAMRLLNAIPAVCAAPPGLLTPFDLPLVTGHRGRR